MINTQVELANEQWFMRKIIINTNFSFDNLFIQWDRKELAPKLLDLEDPALKVGKSYIYSLWLSLLSDWLSTSGCEVYLATPFLDADRIIDICNIVLEFSGTANIKEFYVRNGELDENTKEAKHYFKVKGSEFIEKQVLKKLERKENFHAKFIACTKGSNACVLLTSANFVWSSFDYDNLESVTYHQMSKTELMKRIIDPLKKVKKSKQ